MRIEAKYHVPIHSFRPSELVEAIRGVKADDLYFVTSLEALGPLDPRYGFRGELEEEIHRQGMTIDHETLRNWSETFVQFIWLRFTTVNVAPPIEVRSIDGGIASVECKDKAVCERARTYFLAQGWTILPEGAWKPNG